MTEADYNRTIEFLAAECNQFDLMARKLVRAGQAVLDDPSEGAKQYLQDCIDTAKTFLGQ